MTATIAATLDWHLGRYPLLRAEDIYKLVHQGVYGPGHIIDDPDSAKTALDAEFAEVRKRCCQQPIDPTEPLDPDGRIIRVNLEPLRDVTDAATRLLSAMLESTETIRGDASLMQVRLTTALDWCRDRVPDQHQQLQTIAAEAASTAYPPRHHSRVYATAYRPAYRVTLSEAWNRQATGLGTGSGTCGAPPDPAD